MREIMKVDSVPKAMSFLTALGSVGFLIYGIYGESYWSGFGLVLLMTSLLLIVSLSSPGQVAHSEVQKRTLSTARMRQTLRKEFVPGKDTASISLREANGN